MEAYIYDSKTMEYTGATNCQVDPVRSRKEGRTVYLLPGDSTWKHPPDFDPETQKVKWTGEKWELENIIPEPQPKPEPTYTETQQLGQQLTDLELRFMEYVSTHE